MATARGRTRTGRPRDSCRQAPTDPKARTSTRDPPTPGPVSWRSGARREHPAARRWRPCSQQTSPTGAPRCSSSTPTPTVAAWPRCWACSTRRPGSPQPAGPPTRAPSTSPVCLGSPRSCPRISGCSPGCRRPSGGPRCGLPPRAGARAGPVARRGRRRGLRLLPRGRRGAAAMTPRPRGATRPPSPRSRRRTTSSPWGAPSPVALQRLVRGLQELRDGALPAAGRRREPGPARCGGGAPGGPDRRLAAAVRRSRPGPLRPRRPAVLDACLLAGRSVVELAPDSGVRSAIADLADLLVPSARARPAVASVTSVALLPPGPTAAAPRRAVGRRVHLGRE